MLFVRVSLASVIRLTRLPLVAPASLDEGTAYAPYCEVIDVGSKKVFPGVKIHNRQNERY